MKLFSFVKSVPQCIESQSGKFFVDREGIALSFEPSNDNEFIIEDTGFHENYSYITRKSLRTFIVPEGVRGFVSNFLRCTRVVEKFELPKGLLSIGNMSFDFNSENSSRCVFANCILPTVIIPQTVKEIGLFAFGHSHIDILQLPSSIKSGYGRQFKDSHIGTLILPRMWKDIASLNEYNRLELALNNVDYAYLHWPSTEIERLRFY